MITGTERRYRRLGFLPEFRAYLIRDLETGKLQLWRQSRGIERQAIRVDGMELEFVRDVGAAYRVADDPRNWKNCPDDIGRIFVDELPQNRDVVVTKL